VTLWYAFEPLVKNTLPTYTKLRATTESSSTVFGRRRLDVIEARYVWANAQLPSTELFDIIWFVVYGLIAVAIFV